jgi:hypothetical protein
MAVTTTTKSNGSHVVAGLTGLSGMNSWSQMDSINSLASRFKDHLCFVKYRDYSYAQKVKICDAPELLE